MTSAVKYIVVCKLKAKQKHRNTSLSLNNCPKSNDDLITKNVVDEKETPFEMETAMT